MGDLSAALDDYNGICWGICVTVVGEIAVCSALCIFDAAAGNKLSRKTAIDILICSIRCQRRASRPPGNRFTKGLWAHNWNLWQFVSVLILIIIIWSGHNFAHAMTAELSWYVQKCGLIRGLYFCITAMFILEKFGLWAHKKMVKRGPATALWNTDN